jgi:hypothetical protein
VKRLLLILIPALALGGFYLLDRWLADQHYVLAGDSGVLIYAASFDGAVDSSDGSLNDEWEQYPGRLEAVVENGAMRISVGEENGGSYSLTNRRFADFDLQVDARALEGPLDNGYGVIFRAQDRRNYYLFHVSSDGFYSVYRVLNGDKRELSAWIDMPVVNQGLNVINRLRVVARGSEFQFYINDQLVQVCVPNDPTGISTYFLDECVDGTMQDTLVDDTFPAGNLGVSVEAFRLPDAPFEVVVEFDNLLVYGA